MKSDEQKITEIEKEMMGGARMWSQQEVFLPGIACGWSDSKISSDLAQICSIFVDRCFLAVITQDIPLNS